MTINFLWLVRCGKALSEPNAARWTTETYWTSAACPRYLSKGRILCDVHKSRWPLLSPQHHLNFFSVSFVTFADLRPSFSPLLLWLITGSHETLVSHRQIQHVRMCEHTNTKIPSTHTRARTHAFTLIARREGDYPTVILRMNRNEISVVIYDKSNL